MMILVTGAAGFIGNELALRLVKRGDEVIGIDNLNDYYDVNLKNDRLDRLEGGPIPVFNEGQMQRDFTYIDDIVTGIEGVLTAVPGGDDTWQSDNPDPATSKAPYRIFNIGNSQSVELLQFIKVLESLLGKKAELKMLPMQDGDVKATYANTDALEQATGFKPTVSIEEGLGKFVEWYQSYYR